MCVDVKQGETESDEAASKRTAVTLQEHKVDSVWPAAMTTDEQPTKKPDPVVETAKVAVEAGGAESERTRNSTLPPTLRVIASGFARSRAAHKQIRAINKQKQNAKQTEIKKTQNLG